MEGDFNEINIEVASNFNKMSRDSKKAGYRDGAAAGREQTFQDNFDQGYREGFRAGFAVGKSKGALKDNTKQSSK